MNESTGISNFKFSLLKIFLILAVLLSGLYFAHRSGANPQEYKNDFNVYYFASQEILAGRTPYENSLGDWTPYLYPPLLAELLAPVALLPLPVAAYLWFLISAASLFCALKMSSQLVLQKGMFDWIQLPQSKIVVPAHQNRFEQIGVAALTFAILLRFTLDNFDYGQVNIIVTALAIAHIYFFSKQKPVISSIALILAVAIKLTPAILLLYHIARRRWKYALANATLIAVVVLVSFVPFGTRSDDTFQTFFKRTILNEQKFDLAYSGNQSLRGGLERLTQRYKIFDWLIPNPVTGGLVFLTFLLVMWRSRRETAAAPFFCLMVLLSPLSWKQHFVILLFPIADLIAQTWREKRKGWRAILIAVLVLVFALFNLTSPRLIGIAAAEWCDAASLVLIGGLLIYATWLWLWIYPAPDDQVEG
jgi:alpha-1,2-mannosyltransferase